ncbi:MAG: aquaporin family protein [Chlorobi bacterium]|nr:aquaporin family protein [Chlorobiota bacterium]MCI0715320.1 aquaporin family protein [Chlorobiota bacterium]
MNKYITELIGAFFLVFVIALTGNPLAIGAILMVMVYMGGPISGGHYNPAVSLGVYIRGKLSLNDFLIYSAFQIIGGLIAALIFLYLSGRQFAPATGFDMPFLKSLIAEFIFTFALVLVVLNTATNPKSAGNSYFGLAIGFTVMAGAFAVGPISGGVFNPAVAIGPIIVDTISGGNSVSNLALYLIGPLAGGLAAGVMYKVMNPDEAK